MLPFGLRSAAKIFTAIADVLEWVARQGGVPEIDHYLDDIVTFSSRMPQHTTKRTSILSSKPAWIFASLSGREAGGAHNFSYIPED